jgi:hypothetical protein
VYWEIAFSIEYDFDGQGRIKKSSKRHKGCLKKSYSFRKVRLIKWLTPLSAEAKRFDCESYLNYRQYLHLMIFDSMGNHEMRGS